MKIEEKTSVSIGVSLRGAPVETVPFDANSQDVVELQYEGGLYQWVRVDQLRDDLQKRNNMLPRGAESEHEIVIPPDLGMSAARGSADLLLKGLRILGLDPVGVAADLAVRAIVSKFEDSLQPGPGLYVLSDPRTPERQVADVRDLDNRAPYLLFLHGTASSIAGSFGGLSPSPDDAEEVIPPDDWEALKNRYPGRILGLQHKTLSVSPVLNALDVARLLPDGAQFHLVSHSRGGLIGELLCLNELPKEYRHAFAKIPNDIADDVRAEVQEARKEAADHIDQLSDELGRKHLNVQRFVRVACPARGTVLASKRVDLYLSVLLNVFGLLPALKASPLYSLLKAITMETARRRADPRQLPGIEAMMPESPLINLLNQKDLTSTADLAVIAGDLAAEGPWQRLKMLAVELFYLQPNDLVVNTSAMYGGMERRVTASYFFNKGPHVNHFHYFRNTGTRSLLRKWLEAGKGDKVKGFRPFKPNDTVFVADTRRAADLQEPRPIVFVVPDMMGTQLKDDIGTIWPSLSGLSKRGLDRLAKLDGAVQPGDLIAELYAPMVNRLQQHYRVEQVGYDWRKGVDEIANTLRTRVQACLADEALRKEPIHFVAHGAGALGLLRLAADANFWGQIATRNGHIILLGTPFRGSAAITHLTHPDCRLNRLLQMADHQSDTTPTVLFGSLKTITELRPDSHLDLADPAKLTNVYAITGTADRTVCAIREDNAVLYTPSGDGLVTHDSSRMEGIPTWQVNASHGMFGRHELLTESLVELIEKASASKLPRASAAPPFADAARVLVEEPLFFPTEDDLLDAALGGKSPSQFEVVNNPIKLSVSHGHLRQAKFPVMVGHYQDDMIVSAEKELDKVLGRRLTQRFNMGLYPGRVGTVEIILERDTSRRGALVIGLGEVGELTPEKLRRGVRAAVLRYALLLAEEARTESTGPRAANFSAVLMGTYGQGSVRDSISAVVHGALDANRQLGEHQLQDQVRVEEIEIIELYQDIAVEAAHELLTLAERLNGDEIAGAVIAPEPWLRVREGGRASRPANPYAQGWWRRIKINKTAPVAGETESDGLQFTVLTDHARAEDYVRGTQRQVLEPILLEATSQTVWDENLSTILFQLLIPRDLRSYAQDRVNMVLVIDEDAANYPWELLAQRTRAGVEPLAVQCGLLRQLRSSSSERRMPPASGRAALVVGDTQSGWTDLPGAQAEAEAVHGRLVPRYESLLLTKKISMTIVGALLSRELRILHLAGHGNFDPEDKRQSGMKIGPEQWLTPDILDGMLAAPDLAFVNCCHLGVVKGAKEGTPSPQLAASFAVKLMNLGAKAVVAAGWAVDDRAARVFADRFYQRMLDGDRFGDAVLDARQRTRELYPHSNTWGAYQCYGNPDFRLDGGLPKQGDGGTTERFVARQEVLQKIIDVASQSQAVGLERGDLLNELEQLRDRTPGQWRDGEMLAAFGNAYAQLGNFEDAIAAYRQALADEKGNAPLRAAQQIANLLDRSSRKMTGVQKVTLRKEALDWLEKVAPLADTAELASLRAGYYKRAGDLDKALEAYQRAAEMQRRTSSDGFFYPGLNAAAIAFVLGRAEVDRWRQQIRDCADAASRQSEVERDVWSRAGVVDAMLMMALWNNKINEQSSDIARAYVAIGEGGGAVREIDSILGQIEFLIEKLPPDHAAQGPLRAILTEVKTHFA